MKRVLSLVLALVLVLGMIPTFAAEMTGADHLYEHEFIAGDGTGNLMTEQLLTREQLAKLVLELNGSKEEAEALTLPPSYLDSAKISAWARPYVAYAQIEGLMKGYTDNTFKPQVGVSGQQLAQVLTRALGYEFPWATVVADAADLGIEVATGAALTRGDAFEAMWATVNLPYKGETLPLGVKLGKLPDPTPVVKPLAVESVTATNLKTVVIALAAEVDEDTVSTTTVSVTNKTTTVNLLDDNKTIVVTFAAGQEPAQSAEITVNIDGVKSLDGKETIKEYTKKVVVTDTAIPEITGVQVLNAKQLKFTTSEPMNISVATYQVLSNFKIANVAVIGKVTPSYYDNSFVLEFATVKAAGAYSIEVKDLTDFATYKAITKSLDFTVLADTTAPVMTSAEAVALNKVRVTFDEAVETLGTFKIGTTPVTATEVTGSNKTKFDLTGVTLDLGAIVEVKVTYKGQKDVVGNEVKSDTVFTFKVTDDTALPTVTHELKTGNKIVLTFDKSMLTTAGTIKLLTSTGTVKTTLNVADLTFKTDSDNKVLEIGGTTLGLDNVDPADYTLNIKGMKDATVRANILPETNIVFKALDTKKPEISAVGYKVTNGTKTGADLGKDDYITFYFSEAMDTATLNNLSNYVNSATGSLAAVSGVSVKAVAADAKSIDIIYPQARALTVETFTVYALKDVAGNMLVTATGVAKASTTAPAIASVEASVTNKVVVKFTQEMSSVDPSVIKVQNGTTDYAVGVEAVIKSTDKTVVTFTLDKALTEATAGFNVDTLNHALAKNLLGVAMSGAQSDVAITDKIAPTFASIADGVDGTATDNKFTITFNEAVLVADIADLKNDIVLKDKNGDIIANADYSIEDIQVDTDETKVTFTILSTSGLAQGLQKIDFALVSNRYLKDAAGNFVAPFTASIDDLSVDFVGPTVVTPATTQVAANNGTITVTFSEALSTASKTAVETAIDTAKVAGTLTFSWNAASTVLTVTNTHATNPTVFAADVTANIADINGNTTNNAKVVDLP